MVWPLTHFVPSTTKIPPTKLTWIYKRTSRNKKLSPVPENNWKVYPSKCKMALSKCLKPHLPRFSTQSTISPKNALC